MRSERESKAGLCWESEMLAWGGEILPLMLAACPDGIMLGPLVNTGKQREMGTPEGWGSRSRKGRSKSRLH